MAKEWYEDLNGKEITVIDYKGRKYKGVISGFNYYIGITIQDKETKEYLFCLRGSLAKGEGPRLDRDASYKKYISAIAKYIRKENVFNYYEEDRLQERCYGSSSSGVANRELCPF